MTWIFGNDDSVVVEVEGSREAVGFINRRIYPNRGWLNYTEADFPFLYYPDESHLEYFDKDGEEYSLERGLKTECVDYNPGEPLTGHGGGGGGMESVILIFGIFIRFTVYQFKLPVLFCMMSTLRVRADSDHNSESRYRR